MKAWSLGILLGLLWALPLRAATLQQDYLGVYLQVNEAGQLEKQNDYLSALARYEACHAVLERMHQVYPEWETQLVVRRIADCEVKMTALRPLAGKQLAALNNEWSLSLEGKGSSLGKPEASMSQLLQAQSKITFLETMCTLHPELAKAGMSKRIQDETQTVDEIVDDLVEAQVQAAQKRGAVQ